MKKVLSFLLISVLISGMITVSSFAAPAGDEAAPGTRTGDFIKHPIEPGEIAVNANGIWIEFGEAKPENLSEIPGGDGILPLEIVAETLGCEITKDGDTYTLVYENSDGRAEVTATAGSDTICVNGEEIETKLPHPVEEKNGTVYVPNDFWSLGFSGIGEKTELHGFYWYISIRTNETYMLPTDGTEVAFAADERSYEYEDGTPKALRFRVAQINQDLPGQSTLVVFLHGSNIRGNDNAIPMVMGPVPAISSYALRKNMKLILVVPQADEPMDNMGWKEEPVQNALVSLINEYVNDEQYDIDHENVYLVGASMGAGGTWAIIKKNPDLFTAAMPIASAADIADDSELQNIVKTPVMVVAGEKDTEREFTSPDAIAADVERIEAAGGKVRFDILPGCNHTATCNDACTDENLDWLFGEH